MYEFNDRLKITDSWIIIGTAVIILQYNIFVFLIYKTIKMLIK